MSKENIIAQWVKDEFKELESFIHAEIEMHEFEIVKHQASIEALRIIDRAYRHRANDVQNDINDGKFAKIILGASLDKEGGV